MYMTNITHQVYTRGAVYKYFFYINYIKAFRHFNSFLFHRKS